MNGRSPKGSLRAVRSVVGVAWNVAPGRALVLLACGLGNELAWPAFAIGTKLLIDGVVRGDARAAIVGAALSGGLEVLADGLAWASMAISWSLQERVGRELDRRMMTLELGLAGVEHHERPDLQDALHVIRENRARLADLPNAAGSILRVVVRSLVVLTLLARLDPLLLLLPLFTVPSLLATRWALNRTNSAEAAIAPGRRLAMALFDLATSAAAGKELRIFGLRADLVERHRRRWAADDRSVSKHDPGNAVARSASWLVFGVAYGAAITLIVVRATTGRSSPGDVALVLALGAQVHGQAWNVIGAVTWLQHVLLVGRRYVEMLDHANAAALPDATLAAPSVLRDGIALQNVTFRYPGTDADVLCDASLHLPAGSTIAIVGENGAGKTTIVKLLCRFYEPTSGRIVVDGVPLAGIDPVSWRERIAAGFQDFVRFELIARENVGVGDLERIDDEDAVNAALSRASASEVVDDLPSGLDTQLGRTFTGGVELSAGQWQKLALGRAMMRASPLLLVLDEPTASLDATTEHALFERYAGAASDVARASGAITVLVSHRFSTVRMADLIVVVDGRRIAEVGTHEDLVARAGLYAELYELQARAYR